MVAPLAIAAALQIAKMAAPGMIKWLSGSDKAAEAADKLITVAQQVTGTGNPADAIAKLQADPNLVLQLQARSVEVEATLEQAYLLDRQNARQMEVELAKAGVRSDRKDNMVKIDAWGLGLALVAMVSLGLLKAAYPEGINDGVFGALLSQFSVFASYFGLCLRDAHQFEFGSSRGSKDKDDERKGLLQKMGAM